MTNRSGNPKQLLKLWVEQNGECFYCKCKTILSKRDNSSKIPFLAKKFGLKQSRFDELATRDHRIPISRGGQDHIDNMVMSCYLCNNSKSSLTDVEFVTVMLWGCDASYLLKMEHDIASSKHKSTVVIIEEIDDKSIEQAVKKVKRVRRESGYTKEVDDTGCVWLRKL